MEQLTPRIRDFLEKLVVSHLVKKLSAFYGTEGSLLFSEETATAP
jgi:hypothetical protein